MLHLVDRRLPLVDVDVGLLDRFVNVQTRLTYGTCQIQTGAFPILWRITNAMWARGERSGRLAAFVSRRRGNAKSYRVVSACTRAHGIICVCWLALKSHVVARSLSRSLSLSLSPSVPGSLARSALPTVMLGMEPGVAPTRRCHGTGRAARATAAFTTTCCPTPMHTSEPGGEVWGAAASRGRVSRPVCRRLGAP